MIFFFTKFFDEEMYANDFICGKLFANRLSYFRRLEEYEYANRGDRYEGVINWLNPAQCQLVIDGRDITAALAGPVELHLNWHDNFNVFCVYAGHSGDFKKLTSDNIDGFKKFLKIPEDCLKFGNYAVVVTDASEFLNRVKTAITTNGYRLRSGLVKYYNAETFHGHFDGIDAIFRKRDEYQHQREYRFAIDTFIMGTDPIILDIGDISDITIRCNAADINKTLKIKVTEQ